MTVNETLTPLRPDQVQQKVENGEYAGMLSRMLRAYVRRVAEGDTDDLRRALVLLEQLEEGIAVMVRHLRDDSGYSWADIGLAANVTRQAAYQRWGK